MRGGIVWSPLRPLTGELAEVWEETRTEYRQKFKSATPIFPFG